MRLFTTRLFLLTLGLWASLGCGTDDGGGRTESLAWPTDVWQVESPAAHGMDAATLEGAREYAFRDGKNTQGVVVSRHGVIVAEWYADGRDEESFGASWSVAKSFTSALIGIAIDEGLIDGLDVSMAEFIPSWVGTEREAVTLRDVLWMASGLDWVEDYSPASFSDIIQMVGLERDHLSFVQDHPLAREPGTKFRYSSGDTMLLSGVLEAATGMSAGEYARRKLFEPIGMAPVDWWRDAEGHTLTYCCLDTPTRQFAKFGLLYLRGGEWDGEQVVPAEWVSDSTSPNGVTDRYGYQWWLTGHYERGFPEDLFSARGHDGQYIYVAPSLDLVVVRNGTYDKFDGEPVVESSLFLRYPSDGYVEGAGTVPPDRWDDLEFLTPVLESIVE